eukprot:6486481-Amphidinium_carterae.1
MPILEGRCALLAFKHLLRNTRNLGKKLLLLTDSLTVASCLMKGRSSRCKMQGICRAVAALTLATNSTLQVRWLVSESNYADGPSRGLHWAATPSGQCPWHPVPDAMPSGADETEHEGDDSNRGAHESQTGSRSANSKQRETGSSTDGGSPRYCGTEPKESECDTPDPAEVPRDVGSVLSEGRAHEACQEGLRCSTERRTGSHVSRGTQCPPGAVHVCSSPSPQARAHKALSSCSVGAEGLESHTEVGTQVTNAVAFSRAGDRTFGEVETGRGGMGTHTGPRPLLATRRNSQVEMLRSQTTAAQKFRYQPRAECHLAPKYGSGGVEDAPAGRSAGVRPSTPLKPLTVASCKGEIRACATGTVHAKGGHCRTQAQLERDRSRGMRTPSCLPITAWRSVLGCSRGSPHTSECAAAGEMEFVQQSQALPEGRVCEAGLGGIERGSESAGFGTQCKSSAAGGASCLKRWRHRLLRRVLPAALFTPRLRNCLRDPPVLLEIGGSRSCLGEFALRHFLCLDWATCAGPRYDLLQESNCEQLRCWIRQGRIGALCMHAPRATFGSNYGFRMPFTLTSELGPPLLERHKVFRGDRISRVLAGLARLANYHQVPWMLIGARSSKFFSTPVVRSLSQVSGVRNDELHSCHVGAPCVWPVRVLCGHLWSDFGALAKCKCRSQCVKLRALRRSQQYRLPAQLLKWLVNAFVASQVQSLTESFWIHAGRCQAAHSCTWDGNEDWESWHKQSRCLT